MDNFQIICQNRSLQRWGFYAYRNGQLLKDELGQDKIRNIWNGGNIKDIDPLFKEYSKLYPENIYIIFKSDGAHFATFLNDENKLFDLFENTEVYKMKNIKIFCGSIKYSSIDVMNLSHDFTNLKLLPTCFTSDFHSSSNISFSDDWYAKKDKAIWVGSTTGIYAENNYQGSRRSIYNATKNNPNIFFQFTQSHFKQNEGGIIHKRCNISNNDQIHYKMIICIDGWGFPGSLRWVLHSGCLPVIVCNFKIGILKHLEPWVHYIPAKCDGSDIVQNVEWALQNKDKCKLILENLHNTIKEMVNPSSFKKELKEMF